MRKGLAIRGWVIGLMGSLLVLTVWNLQQGRELPFVSAKADGLTPKIVNADLIRVGLSDNAMANWEYPLTQLSATSPYHLKDKGTGAQLLQREAGQVVAVTVSSSGFWVRPVEQGTALGPFAGPLVAEPEGDGQMKVMNITRRGSSPSYRGSLEIVRGASSPARLSVVNVLLMEDYLRAVVPNELPPRYGYEAVRAQAVAARNYAIRPREKPWPQFDICDSQACQVYFGSHTETPETNLALRETQGVVALYASEPILALYSSSHGGVAENYSYAFSEPKTNQFPASPLPYLAGGPDLPSVTSLYGDLRQEKAARVFWTAKADSFDVLSPYYRWQKLWKKGEIEAVLNKTLATVSQDSVSAPFIAPHFHKGQRVGVLKRVVVKERGISGKAMVVEIQASGGRWILRKENVIRRVFQSNGKMLPSANVVFTHLTGAKGRLLGLKANGGGFGHGVGMSQLGASWMSSHGYGFPDILQHYYKGVALGSVPLEVGTGHYQQPVQNSFFVKQGRPVLRVETDDPARPINIEVNGQKVSLDALQGAGTSYGLEGLVRLGETNTVAIWPDAQQPQRRIKVWVELYPPKAESVTAKALPVPLEKAGEPCVSACQ